MENVYKENRAMIRVTIVCSCLVRQGPINVLYNMLCAYKRSKTDVVYQVVTLSPEKDISRKKEYEALGVEVKSCNLPAGLKTLRGLKQIKELILSTSPDIVQSSGYRSDIIISMIRLPGIKKVSTLWNYPYDDYEMDYGRVQGALMAFSHLIRLRRFDRVIPCSKFIASRIEKYGLRLSIIYTGVPMDYYAPLSFEERMARRRDLGIPQDAHVYIFIANLITRKNPEILVRAFQKEVNRNALLLVMGDGPLFDKCRSLNSNPNVRFLGRQPDTLYYLQVSDYYISPSLSEGFPTAVLEAMSVGVMPILSNIPPHLEMIEGVPYDISFSPHSQEQLCASITKAQAYRGEIDYRKYMEDNFSDIIMFSKFESVYNRLINNKIAGGGGWI